MTYLIHYDAVALFLDLVAAYLFITRKNLRDDSSRRFGALLFSATGSAALGLLGSLSVNASAPASASLALNGASMLLLNAVPALAAWYLLSAYRSRLGTRVARIAFFLPCALAILVIAASFRTGWAFSASPSGGFQDGPAIPLLDALALWYLAWAFIAYLRRRRSLSASARVLMPAVLGLPALTMAVGGFFPRVPLESFSISIAILIILFTVEDAGSLRDATSGLLNEKAFSRFLERGLRNGAELSVILMKAANMQSLRRRLSPTALDAFGARLGAFLSASTGTQAQAFRLDDASFALLAGNRFRGGIPSVIDDLARSLAQEWDVEGSSPAYRPRVCVIKCPEEVSDILDIQDCLEQMDLSWPVGAEGRVLGPSDLGVLGVRREAEIEGAILDAIATNRIGVLWQPIVDADGGRVVQADTQICLYTNNGELISQRDLLRVSERSGSAHRLGFLALKTICSAYASLDMARRGVERVQVRLSAFQCLRSDLPQQILAVTEALGLEPSRLCLEITEAAATHSPEAATRNMRLLSAQGVTFALDDYGSGYTDLGCILDMPFDLIKLDKAVIRAGSASERGRMVLEGTVALLRRLNRRIAAEGVETEGQERALIEAGVDYLQGFRYGAPETAEAFATRLSP